MDTRHQRNAFLVNCYTLSLVHVGLLEAHTPIRAVTRVSVRQVVARQCASLVVPILAGALSWCLPGLPVIPLCGGCVKLWGTFGGCELDVC